MGRAAATIPVCTSSSFYGCCQSMLLTGRMLPVFTVSVVDYVSLVGTWKEARKWLIAPGGRDKKAEVNRLPGSSS